MLLVLLLLSGLSGAADDQGCRRCEHRGVVPCTNHDKNLTAAESEVLFCSRAAACEACGGALLVDCARCEGGPENAAVEQRRASIRDWLASTPIEARLGRPLPRIETEHFRLVVETGDVREGRKKVDQHSLIHAIAGDVEAVARGLDEHFVVVDGDYFTKMQMWIWGEPESHKEVMLELIGSGSSGDFKMLGRAPKFSVWTEPNLFDRVDTIRALFAHNAAHMLLSNLERELWFGDLGGGWLDAGVGHYYEYELFGRSTQFCIEEATLSETYADGVWRAAIRKRLDKEDRPQLPPLLDRNTGAMKQSDQALCWSFYEWLVLHHAAKLRPMLDDLKQKMAARDVLKTHLGLSVLEIDAAWRAWVAASYPLKGDKLRGR